MTETVGRWRARWRWWVGLWDRHEAPLSLACVRVMLPLVLVWDLVATARLGLVPLLWTPMDAGGLSRALTSAHPPALWSVLEPTVQTAWGLWAALIAAALCVSIGAFTRVATVALLLLYAQSALIQPGADRGIDILIRNVFLLMAFSRWGAGWSVDARWRTGQWSGGEMRVPAWPRHLLIVQLVFMYFMAGVQKVALTWTPMGGYTALYYVLKEPQVARADFAWLDTVYPLTQVATGVTHLWEWLSPLVLLAYIFRDTRSKPGHLRAFFNHTGVLWGWIAIGAFFHITLAFTLRLGIFPFAMLALYPAFAHPDELKQFLHRVAGYVKNLFKPNARTS